MRGIELLSLGFRDALRASWSPDNQVVLYIGENGSGKSRLLERIGRDAVRQGRPLILIANTAFDRFAGIRGRGVKKLRVRGGSRVAETTLKRAISDAVEKDELRLRRISRVLEYCRYGSTLGVSLHKGAGNTQGWRSDEELQGVPEDEIASIVSLLESGDLPYKSIIEIDFESAGVSKWSLLPSVIRHGGLLKRLGFVNDIRLHLRRRDEWIQLRDASSGELSLITTMAFLAVNVRSDTLVLVDEPENSLHPRWQQEYLNLALQFLGYEGAALRIATHSPLLVSSAGLESGAQSVAVALNTFADDRAREPVAARLTPVGVEGVLTEAFNTVTPENHYLSLAITALLEKLASRSLTLDQVTSKITAYQRASEDSTQVEALAVVRELASKIDAGERRDPIQ